jgi:hypothetical protein
METSNLVPFGFNPMTLEYKSGIVQKFRTYSMLIVFTSNIKIFHTEFLIMFIIWVRWAGLVPQAVIGVQYFGTVRAVLWSR